MQPKTVSTCLIAAADLSRFAHSKPVFGFLDFFSTPLQIPGVDRDLSNSWFSPIAESQLPLLVAQLEGKIQNLSVILFSGDSLAVHFSPRWFWVKTRGCQAPRFF
jgi:hypothetical protein